MLPRGQAWQDCISLCVSIRLREPCGILAGLGYLLDRPLLPAMVNESLKEAPSSYCLTSVTCPNDTSFSIPLEAAKIILASPTTKHRLPDTCVSAPGIRPRCWAHGVSQLWRLELAPRAGRLRCRTLQKFSSKIGWLEVFSVCLSAFSGRVFICSNRQVLVS